jgi:hypothetical protein
MLILIRLPGLETDANTSQHWSTNDDDIQSPYPGLVIVVGGESDASDANGCSTDYVEGGVKPLA